MRSEMNSLFPPILMCGVEVSGKMMPGSVALVAQLQI